MKDLNRRCGIPKKLQKYRKISILVTLTDCQSLQHTIFSGFGEFIHPSETSFLW